MPRHIDRNGWHADFNPERGALLYRLKHDLSGEFDLMRTPSDPAALSEQPMLWGFPVLFPPNRIAEGTFHFQGRRYTLPLNDPAVNCHIHGILLRACWEYAEDGEAAVMTLHRGADEIWPNEFKTVLRYDFLPNRMEQSITFENRSPLNMPFLFGYHTAFHVEDGMLLRVTADPESWTMDPGTKRPDERRKTIDPDWTELRRTEELGPVFQHLPMRTEKDFRGVLLCSPRRHFEWRYTVDGAFRFWTLWNGAGTQNFFCAEPQTCLINAPNLSVPPDESGMDFMRPGEKRILRCALDISPK